MEVFVARQPILDKSGKVIYYELLFRSSHENYYTGSNGEEATLDVIANTFTLIGMKNLTNGKRAFINFTEDLLLQEVPIILPRDKIVVEILETVKPSAKLIECCKKFKNLGYKLALDDFAFKPGYEELVNLADFIKVDFLIIKGDERKKIIERYGNENVKFLAEKVETLEDFNDAANLGYTYFQGYFFSRPVILNAREMPSRNYDLDLLKFASRNNYEIDKIEPIIKKNVALTYKLLKYINSAFWGLKTEIHSIKQALVLLGREEIKKWIVLVTLRNFIDKGSEAIMDAAIVRARFGEMIANSINLESKASEVFIMEMFLNIDVLLRQPMNEALEELPISNDIKAALLGEDNLFGDLNKLILSYEKADWESFSYYAKKVNIKENTVPYMYTDALEWAAFIVKE